MPTKAKASPRKLTPAKPAARGVTSPAPKASLLASTAPAKPVTNTAPLGTAAAKQAATSNVATKPAKPGKAVAASTPTVAKPAAHINRTASTIAAQRTNFGGVLSDRDVAYFGFFARLAKRANGKPVTIADIVASTDAPAYNGSAKKHDAGVIVRLSKANILTVAPDGSSFTFTKAALTHAAYTSAKA